MGDFIKVKKLFRKLLLPAALLLLALLALVSCSGSDNGQKEYDHLVTFDYNVGTNITSNCQNQFLGVMDAATVSIQPGYSESFQLQEVIGYYNEGWYTAKTDGNGQPVLDADSGRVVLDRKWDFENDKVTSDLSLYANFLPKSVLTVMDHAGTVYLTYSEKPGASRKEPSSVYTPKKEGYTFYGYFTEDGEPFSWPYTFGTEDTTVYAEFIEGDWTVVRTAQAFVRAISANPRAKIYVDADLDFSETGWLSGREFNGEINGNGHRLTGITCSFAGGKKTQSNFGLFGILKSEAQVHDITFENVTATFTATFASVYEAGLFAWQMDEGAVVRNVTVSGSLSLDAVPDGTVAELYPFVAIDYTDGAWKDLCDIRVDVIS